MECEKIILGFIVSIIFASCELSPFKTTEPVPPVPPIQPEETYIEEQNTMFQQEEGDNGFVFETNDTRYLTSTGYTLWSVPNINNSKNFEEISVGVTKQSGRTEAGFGVVFCRQTIDEKPYMLTVLINANGYYTIGKVYDGVFRHINEGWESSNYIKRGLGIKNLINITYDENNTNFTLKLNGYEITNFSVEEEILFRESKSGYVVVIANNENFPKNSVKVFFENK